MRSEYIALLISAAGVLAALWTAKQARIGAVVGVYLSDAAAAYAGFFRSVEYFVYHRDDRDAYHAVGDALHILMLYAPDDLCADAQELYVFLYDWGRSQEGGLPVDQRLNLIGKTARKDLLRIQKAGKIDLGKNR